MGHSRFECLVIRDPNHASQKPFIAQASWGTATGACEYMRKAISRLSVWYGGAACSGANLGTSEETATLGDTAGNWQAIGKPFQPAALTQSAFCSVVVNSADGDGFSLWLDQMHFNDGDLIFDDGFEP